MNGTTNSRFIGPDITPGLANELPRRIPGPDTIALWYIVSDTVESAFRARTDLQIYIVNDKDSLYTARALLPTVWKNKDVKPLPR